MSPEYDKKYPCTECGEPTWKLCYLKSGHSERLVCVDCFGAACRAAESARQLREKQGKETNI